MENTRVGSSFFPATLSKREQILLLRYSHQHNHRLQFILWREHFGSYSELVKMLTLSTFIIFNIAQDLFAPGILYSLIIWDMGYFQWAREWYFFFAESYLSVKCICKFQTSSPLQYSRKPGAASYEGEGWYCHWQVDHSQASHIMTQNRSFLI